MGVIEPKSNLSQADGKIQGYRREHLEAEDRPAPTEDSISAAQPLSERRFQLQIIKPCSNRSDRSVGEFVSINIIGHLPRLNLAHLLQVAGVDVINPAVQNRTLLFFPRVLDEGKLR